MHPVLEAALIGDCSTQATLSPVVLMPTPAYKRRSRHTQSGIELPRCDGPTIAAKRYRTLVQQFSSELGAGMLSAVDAGLIRQAAAIVLQVEKMQAQIVEGIDVDPDLIIRLTSEHRRLLEILKGKGSKRTESNAVDDLQSYLANQAGGAA